LYFYINIYTYAFIDGDDDSESAVVTLTDANFKEEVTDSSADMLVEFYAPWCGHCKSLKPEYKGVAAHFKDDAGISIAAMDATAHTVPSTFDVKGYPTIYFVPGNDKKNPVSYDGER
jgi:protein disulfide isomerase family A protein 3